MSIKALVLADAIALTFAVPSIAAAEQSAVHQHDTHHVIDHDKVIDVLRARHLRYIGQPFLRNGRYVIRCYDDFSHLSYCFVDPHSGRYLGMNLKL